MSILRRNWARSTCIYVHQMSLSSSACFTALAVVPDIPFTIIFQKLAYVVKLDVSGLLITLMSPSGSISVTLACHPESELLGHINTNVRSQRWQSLPGGARGPTGQALHWHNLVIKTTMYSHYNIHWWLVAGVCEPDRVTESSWYASHIIYPESDRNIISITRLSMTTVLFISD